MRERPWQHKRAACEEQQHHRLSGGGHFFEQFLLPAGQHGVRARTCLARHLRRVFSQRQYCDIRGAGSRNALFDLCVTRGEILAALGILDVSAPNFAS